MINQKLKTAKNLLLEIEAFKECAEQDKINSALALLKEVVKDAESLANQVIEDIQKVA